MFFVGHTRFSLYLPGSTAWAATRRFSSAEEYQAYLFSEERLAPRAEMFFERSLPQIDLAVRSHRVQHIVSYSDVLPSDYKNRMHEASTKYPWLVLDEYEDGRGKYNADRVAANMLRHNGVAGGIYGNYRLDDDDLLAVDYFDRMAAHMHDSSVGMYVSLGAGITAIQSAGRFWNARHVMQRMFSAGLLSVCRRNEDGTVDRPLNYFSHHLADQRSPVISDSRSPGFFWNRTVLQDTSFSTSEVDLPRLNNELSRLRSPASTHEVIDLFPVMQGLVELEAAPVAS
ncbi:hypothetical protein GCM10023258_13420 [Terrabacter aeriphilus]|uniref:Rhamnosyltransferase n=1 Tax=Terrabacter aeriphilus TaxID=515662 RepID=A0ABP9J8T8_9MICO